MPRSPGRGGYRYRLACQRLRQPGAVCCLCGGDIDVTLKFPDLWSWTLQHVDGDHYNNHPDNLDSAHLHCNSKDGAQRQAARARRTRATQLGVSRQW